MLTDVTMTKLVVDNLENIHNIALQLRKEQVSMN